MHFVSSSVVVPMRQFAGHLKHLSLVAGINAVIVVVFVIVGPIDTVKIRLSVVVLATKKLILAFDEVGKTVCI